MGAVKRKPRHGFRSRRRAAKRQRRGSPSAQSNGEFLGRATRTRRFVIRSPEASNSPQIVTVHMRQWPRPPRFRRSGSFDHATNNSTNVAARGHPGHRVGDGRSHRG